MDFFVTFVFVLGSVFLHCDKLPGWLCMQRGRAGLPSGTPTFASLARSDNLTDPTPKFPFLSTLLSSSYLISS